MLGKLWDRVRGVFGPRVSEGELRQQLDQLRAQTPVPVFWLFGKTQSGKSSIIRYLTGAEKAEIGKGFQPCTRFSSMYQFPTEQAPLMTFLDTRGLDEPGYDAGEDLARFNEQAHVVIVTIKLLDHALDNLITNLRRIRAAQPRRPIVLAVTCLHEAYPQQQHPEPYPFDAEGRLTLDPGASAPATAFAEVRDSLAFHRERFGDLIDRVVPLDLTPPEEGFSDPNYGGHRLREVLLDVLPGAQAQTLRTLDAAQNDLKGLFARKAAPTIVAYSSLAATAGAVPIPVVDMLLISAVQTSMVNELAQLYGQPLTKQRMAELASTLGLGLLTRQAGRSLIKIIPGLGSILGSVAGGAMAAGSTYALGQAFCYYYSAVLQGHVPDAKDLKRFYEDQLQNATQAWEKMHGNTGNGDQNKEVKK